MVSKQKNVNFANLMDGKARYLKMLKKVFLILMVFTGFQSRSQSFDCTIFPGDTTVCYGQSIYLYTAFADSLKYSWEPNGETGVIIEVVVTDTVDYIVHAYNHDSTFHCTDTVTLSIYPRIVIEFEQLVFGCPPADTNQVDTICKAQVKATTTGGYLPHHYYWGDSVLVNPGDSSWALNLCVQQTYTFRVWDTVCVFDEEFYVEPFNMPTVEVTVSPDSLFITNPQAILSFENKSADSIMLTNWTWIFPDESSTNQLSPSYVFTLNDSLVKFAYTTSDNCNDTLFIPISVREFELNVPNVFTPNGDGINDRYEIPYLDRYISNELMVFNRWGEMVFREKNYTGSWDGGRLSDGVYFYVLKCKGYWEEDVFRGSVSIFGSRY